MSHYPECSGIVIDWEKKHKELRQNLYNTQINEHTLQDLINVRELSDCWIICRVNGGENISEDEIIKAIEYGANEIMLPMIDHPDQLEKSIKIIDGQAKVITMIETTSSIDWLTELNKLPVDRFFVGLNDLAIDRKERNIFRPLLDGTIDLIRERTTNELGFGGLTHPQLGVPIPSNLLLSEMKRLECGFSFLRRSFLKDLNTYSIKEIIVAINNYYSNIEVNDSHQLQLHEQIKSYSSLNLI